MKPNTFDEADLNKNEVSRTEAFASNEDKFEKRRRNAVNLVGVVSLPDDFDAGEIKEERLSRLKF